MTSYSDRSLSPLHSGFSNGAYGSLPIPVRVSTITHTSHVGQISTTAQPDDLGNEGATRDHGKKDNR